MAADASTTRGSTEHSGGLLAEVSRALVALYKECYGKGPTKARTHLMDDVLVCLLEGGFLKAERTLRDAGRQDVVAGQREAFQEVLRERFVDTVETLVGRKVVSFISGVDLHTETSAELFVLAPPPQETGDEREAISAWAEQTRRQSRVLRERQAALRQEQADLRRS